MLITDATPEDISGIQALAETVFRQLYPTLDAAALNKRLQRIYGAESLQRAITGDAAWLLVVRENDQLIGLAHFGSPLLDDCQERKEIYKFYIHPDYMRQGIGGKIIKEIAKRLRQTQIVNECMVYVAGDDAPRLSFFEKNGFRHMADSDRDGEWYLVKNV